MNNVKQENYITFRHGEVDRAKDLIIGSGTNLPLNERGIEQAFELAQFVRDMYERPRIILSSPLLRALQTSEIISNSYERPIPILTIPELQAQNFGILENHRVSEAFQDPALNPYLYANISNEDRYSMTPPDGESLEHLEKRVIQWFIRLSKNVKPNKLLFITHASILKAINGSVNKIEAWRWEEALNIGYLDSLELSPDIKKVQFSARRKIK